MPAPCGKSESFASASCQMQVGQHAPAEWCEVRVTCVVKPVDSDAALGVACFIKLGNHFPVNCVRQLSAVDSQFPASFIETCLNRTDASTPFTVVLGLATPRRANIHLERAQPPSEGAFDIAFSVFEIICGQCHEAGIIILNTLHLGTLPLVSPATKGKNNFLCTSNHDMLKSVKGQLNVITVRSSVGKLFPLWGMWADLTAAFHFSPLNTWFRSPPVQLRQVADLATHTSELAKPRPNCKVQVVDTTRMDKLFTVAIHIQACLDCSPKAGYVTAMSKVLKLNAVTILQCFGAHSAWPPPQIPLAPMHSLSRIWVSGASGSGKMVWMSNWLGLVRTKCLSGQKDKRLLLLSSNFQLFDEDVSLWLAVLQSFVLRNGRTQPIGQLTQLMPCRVSRGLWSFAPSFSQLTSTTSSMRFARSHLQQLHSGAFNMLLAMRASSVTLKFSTISFLQNFGALHASFPSNPSTPPSRPAAVCQLSKISVSIVAGSVKLTFISNLLLSVRTVLPLPEQKDNWRRPNLQPLEIDGELIRMTSNQRRTMVGLDVPWTTKPSPAWLNPMMQASLLPSMVRQNHKLAFVRFGKRTPPKFAETEALLQQPHRQKLELMTPVAHPLKLYVAMTAHVREGTNQIALIQLHLSGGPVQNKMMQLPSRMNTFGMSRLSLTSILRWPTAPVASGRSFVQGMRSPRHFTLQPQQQHCSLHLHLEFFGQALVQLFSVFPIVVNLLREMEPLPAVRVEQPRRLNQPRFEMQRLSCGLSPLNLVEGRLLKLNPTRPNKIMCAQAMSSSGFCSGKAWKV